MEKKKHDQYQVLEQSREAAIQSIANVLDGMSKAKKLRRRFEANRDDDRQRAEKDDGDEKSDFLFDMLRLNATYLNEAARLGARYRDFAYRALENMYRVANPASKNESADELVFARSIKHPDEFDVSRQFVVKNDVNPNVDELKISVPRVRNARTRDWLDVVRLYRLNGRKKAPIKGGSGPGPREEFHVEVTYGVPLVIVASADLSLCKGRKYDDDHFIVTLPLSNGGSRVRRIAVIYDGRAPSDPVAGKSRSGRT